MLFRSYDDPLIAEPPHPINWNLLNADDAEVEWLELNRWVDWLRHTCLAEGYISESDLDMFLVTDDEAAAVAHVTSARTAV